MLVDGAGAAAANVPSVPLPLSFVELELDALPRAILGEGSADIVAVLVVRCTGAEIANFLRSVHGSRNTVKQSSPDWSSP